MSDGKEPSGDPDEAGGDGGESAEAGGRFRDLSRRDILKYGAGAAVLGGLGALAADQLVPEGPTIEATYTDTDDADLARQYAPHLYFGRYEEWFPTDPRPYASERDGETVVEGFDALDGYAEGVRAEGSPPRPTVFYRTLSAEGTAMTVVQYWMYSAFDQFSVNFHWHDWELLQVFVDTDADEAVLLSASAHARSVPNNEYVDPPTDERPIRVLSEVGAHASATDLNEDPTFQRFSTGDLVSDVTNGPLNLADVATDFPSAYGLPRDEGGRLPYVVPQLDGDPLYEHDRLPNVRSDDLIDDALTVRSLWGLTEIPTGIPRRESGVTMVPEGDEQGDDVTYALTSIAPVAEELDAFDGPQLSFEFSIPGFVEDRFADHLTSSHAPWTDDRYTDPDSDVTDPRHRRTLVDRFDLETADGGGTTAGNLAGKVSALTGGGDGTLRDAPDGVTEELGDEVSVSLTAPAVEAGCLVESEDPVAVPTVRGVVNLVDLPPAEHRLTVNAAGYAPHAERLAVGEGERATPGDGGRLSVVPQADAVKVRGDAADLPGVETVRVADDFAGATFDGRPPTDGGFGVYVHREGSYTLDVRDTEGVYGAYRVDPPAGGAGDDDGGDSDQGDPPVDLGRVETGKGPLAGFLVDYLEDAAALAAEYAPDASGGQADGGDGQGDGGGGNTTRTTPGKGEGGGGGKGTGTTTATATNGTTTGGGGDDQYTGLARAFQAAAATAARAGEAANRGDADAADQRLRAVRQRLDGLRTALDQQTGDDLSETLGTVFDDRAERADLRAKRALDAPE